MAVYAKGRVTPIKRGRFFMDEQKQPDGTVLGAWTETSKATKEPVLGIQRFAPGRKAVGDPILLPLQFVKDIAEIYLGGQKGGSNA